MKKQETEKGSVLIIEDDIDMCIMLTYILRNKNISSSFVNSLTDARKIFEVYNPAVILLDNQLPDGQGLHFISYAKVICPNTKIIMITARSNEYTRKTAIKRGAAYFVSKPFCSKELSGIIDKVMEGSRSQ